MRVATRVQCSMGGLRLSGMIVNRSTKEMLLLVQSYVEIIHLAGPCSVVILASLKGDHGSYK
jgi:hypothetical protein